MRKPDRLPLGALLAAAALFNACSCSNKCTGVTCPARAVCVPEDGLCHCGGVDGDAGPSNVVCGPGEACDQNLQACVSTLCEQPDGGPCSNGTTCDPADGVCKCGAAPCAAGQLCNPISHLCATEAACQGVSCSLGQACDPLDGTCKCGAAPCGAGQLCADGGCVSDPCFGVTCVGQNNQCYGGVCHCGASAGPICDQEQFCDGTACRENSVCANVVCEPGTVCGAQDALCHCGAPSGPICRGSSTCVLYLPDSGLPLPPDAGALSGGPGVIFGRCLGGDLCAGVLCAAGESCDSATGACLCGTFDGGTPPLTCNVGQVCGADALGNPLCQTPCSPYGARCPPILPTDGGAVQPQACYYDPALGQALCQKAGTHAEGDACGLPNECLTGMSCEQPPPELAAAGAVPSCRAYCNSFDGGTLGCNLQDRQCFPVTLITTDAGNLAIGACWPPLPPDAGGV